MGAERRKISKSSWPRTVVRKWLNIQSGGDEFYSDSYTIKEKPDRRRSCPDQDRYIVVPEDFSDALPVSLSPSLRRSPCLPLALSQTLYLSPSRPLSDALPVSLSKFQMDEQVRDFTLFYKDEHVADDKEDEQVAEAFTVLDKDGDVLMQDPATTFEELNLSPLLLKGLYAEMHFKRPSKIQGVSLPLIITPPHRDLLAQADNGSGKTACFVLGMLSRIDPDLKTTQALCVCPTRELAIQNVEVLRKIGQYTSITSECAVAMDKKHYAPISKQPPVSAQAVIGTPGTIKKWMSNRKLDLTEMKILVFDEADHMLAEDGFKDDSLKIKEEIGRRSSHCQVLLFCATCNANVKKFLSRIVEGYNQLFVKKDELSLKAVKQYKVHCPDERTKTLVIRDRILELGENVGQTIIFVLGRDNAIMLHRALADLGYAVTTIQGAISAEDRDKIVQEFKKSLTKVLISTDLLSRGFDQQQVNLVINYDLPVKYQTSEPDYEVYLHRMGRTGRFGRKGAVFNLLCGDNDKMLMSKIEHYFGSKVEEVKSWESEEDFNAALKAAKLL